MLSIVIVGVSTYSITTLVRIATPVGVASSPRTGHFAIGTPFNNSAVPGVGTGIIPWAHFTVPLPTATGDEVKRSAPSRSKPTAAPMMSAMLSSAPTSWKCTRSSGIP